MFVFFYLCIFFSSSFSTPIDDPLWGPQDPLWGPQEDGLRLCDLYKATSFYAETRTGLEMITLYDEQTGNSTIITCGRSVSTLGSIKDYIISMSSTPPYVFVMSKNSIYAINPFYGVNIKKIANINNGKNIQVGIDCLYYLDDNGIGKIII